MNGQLLKKVSTPKNGYVFEFPDVKMGTGYAHSRRGYNVTGKRFARHELATAGPATRIKLTPVVGPAGFLADGADVASSSTWRWWTEQGVAAAQRTMRVDFHNYGAGHLARGGYNSGKNRLDQ